MAFNVYTDDGELHENVPKLQMWGNSEKTVLREFVASNDVPAAPSGIISITTNGTHDVSGKEFAAVNVQSQQPSGSMTINANGTYDVSWKASVIVNVPSSGNVSLSATYSGGSVEAGTSIDTLKSDLTVKMVLPDSTEVAIASTDYTLTGTIIAGSNTITVNYGGMTTTVTVTGVAIPTYSVTIPTVTGVTLTVMHGATPLQSGDTVQSGEDIVITAAAETGYNVTAVTVSVGDGAAQDIKADALADGATITVTGAVVIVASADENPEPDVGQNITYATANVQNNGGNIYVNFSTIFNLAGYRRIEVYLERSGGWGGADGFGGKGDKTNYAAYEPNASNNWKCVEFETIDPTAKPTGTWSVDGVMTLDADGKKLTCGCPHYSAALWAYTGSPVITVKGFAV